MFGRTNGDLAWGLNRYTDGSGSNTEVVPCISLGEAREVAQEHVKIRASTSEERPREDVVSAAEQFKSTLPESYLRKFREQRTSLLEKQIKESETKMRQIQAELKTLKDSDGQS